MKSYAASNILLHQICKCESPLQCICPGDGNVTYLLGDVDLFEEESANQMYSYNEWKNMASYDPAGTIGVKPPEVI